MSILLLESPEEVILLTALVGACTQMLALILFTPLVYVVVLGKSDKPAKRVQKIATALHRAPKA